LESGGSRLATIDTIRRKIRDGDFELVIPHFLEEMVNDDLSFADIESAIARGRVRRRFTHDPRGTRYELVGPTRNGRRAAVICRIKGTGKVLLVTTYVVG
jgi:hypothetical protein